MERSQDLFAQRADATVHHSPSQLLCPLLPTPPPVPWPPPPAALSYIRLGSASLAALNYDFALLTLDKAMAPDTFTLPIGPGQGREVLDLQTAGYPGGLVRLGVQTEPSRAAFALGLRCGGGCGGGG